MVLIYVIVFLKILALPIVATWLYNRVYFEAGYEGLARVISWVPCVIPFAWLAISQLVLPTATMLSVATYINFSGALNAVILIFLIVPLGFLAFSSWPIFVEED